MKSQETDRIAALIYNAPIGEYIGRDGAAILAERAADERHLEDGEFLYRKGEVTNSFFIIAEGRLALVREKGADRPPTIVHVLEKGDLVGELGFIDQTPHTLSVRALCNATVLSFSAENIKPLITEHPTVIYNFMRAVVKRVHHAVTTVGEHERELRDYISTGGRGRS